MRQVPQYLIIGNGRVARHFQHYFTLLQFKFLTWHRHESIDLLKQRLAEASHVLLLISDQAIDEFIATHLTNRDAICVHFSGSLVCDAAYGAHPLTTFNQGFYDLEQYLTIPFIVDDDAPAFASLLPGLPNPHVSLAKAQKAKYHALCVLSGNFSCMLWQKIFTNFESEFNMPASIAHHYLQQVTHNLMTDHKTALTGPLVRGDLMTIEKNLTALKSDPFYAVYQSFVACYQEVNEEGRQ